MINKQLIPWAVSRTLVESLEGDYTHKNFRDHCSRVWLSLSNVTRNYFISNLLVLLDLDEMTIFNTVAKQN